MKDQLRRTPYRDIRRAQGLLGEMALHWRVEGEREIAIGFANAIAALDDVQVQATDDDLVVKIIDLAITMGNADA